MIHKKEKLLKNMLILDQKFINFILKVYAGITRMGISLDKIANKYEV